MIKPRHAGRRLIAVAAAALLAAAALQGVGASRAGAAAPTCGGEVPPAKPDGSAWTCTFDDEFGSVLLSSTWTKQQTVNSAFTTGLPPYRVCYVTSSNNVAQSGGYLKLTVRKLSAPMTCKDPAGNFTTSYTGGMVSSIAKFSQTYGRFSVRAKLPNTTVKGLQETLWLWPNNDVKYAGTGPAKCEPSGEIDFAEMYSLYADWNIPYLHYCPDANYPANWTTNTNVFTNYPAPNAQPGTNCQMDHTQFNVYTAVWQPGRITLYVNGQTCLVDN